MLQSNENYRTPEELKSYLLKVGQGDGRKTRRWLEVEYLKIRQNVDEISQVTANEYYQVFRDFGRADLGVAVIMRTPPYPDKESGQGVDPSSLGIGSIDPG